MLRRVAMHPALAFSNSIIGKHRWLRILEGPHSGISFMPAFCISVKFALTCVHSLKSHTGTECRELEANASLSRWDDRALRAFCDFECKASSQMKAWWYDAAESCRDVEEGVTTMMCLDRERQKLQRGRNCAKPRPHPHESSTSHDTPSHLTPRAKNENPSCTGISSSDRRHLVIIVPI